MRFLLILTIFLCKNLFALELDFKDFEKKLVNYASQLCNNEDFGDAILINNEVFTITDISNDLIDDLIINWSEFGCEYRLDYFSGASGWGEFHILINFNGNQFLDFKKPFEFYNNPSLGIHNFGKENQHLIRGINIIDTSEIRTVEFIRHRMDCSDGKVEVGSCKDVYYISGNNFLLIEEGIKIDWKGAEILDN